MEYAKGELKTQEKRGFKDWFQKKNRAASEPTEGPTLSAPPPPDGVARFVHFAPLIGGLLGAALGAGSWIRREDHRISVCAFVFSLIALCWQWIALGVGVGVALAILIAILSAISS